MSPVRWLPAPLPSLAVATLMTVAGLTACNGTDAAGPDPRPPRRPGEIISRTAMPDGSEIVVYDSTGAGKSSRAITALTESAAGPSFARSATGAAAGSALSDAPLLSTTSTALVDPAAPYTVAGIAFAPEAPAAVNANLQCDDCVRFGVPIGFLFTFSGNTYGTIDISSNGVVGFPGGYMNGRYYPDPIPALAPPNNYIAASWSDWFPYYGSLTYETRGTAPNRRFLIEWRDVPMCCSLNEYRLSSQIILYETSNVIEVHTQSKGNSYYPSTQGIENLAGTAGVAVAGRNAQAYGLANDAVRFTPAPTNAAPLLNVGGPYTGPEGAPIALDASRTTDPDGDALTFGWDFNGDGTYTDATGPRVSTSYPDNGTYSVSVRATDAHGSTTTGSAHITVTNVAPTATFGNTGPVTEGTAFALSLSGATDPSRADVAAGLQFAFDCGTGLGYGSASTTSTASCTTTDDALRSVKGKVMDKDGGVTEYTASVTVNNAAPVVTAVTLPSTLIALGNPVALSASFTDVGTGDTHTGAFDLDLGGSTAPGTASATGGAGTMTGTHTYTAAGVYTITATVTDDDRASGSRSSVLDIPAYVVVYDPSGSFVTGGGWITSPTGACAALCAFTGEGRASFGFVSKYLPGRTEPSGNTEFEFKAGGFRFKSTSYEWLVVSGARAQYKGEGTVNGGGRYGFLLTAVDGALDRSDSRDRFRIKVWDKLSGEVVYDNQRGQAEDADASIALGGGSIVIHR